MFALPDNLFSPILQQPSLWRNITPVALTDPTLFFFCQTVIDEFIQIDGLIRSRRYGGNQNKRERRRWVRWDRRPRSLLPRAADSLHICVYIFNHLSLRLVFLLTVPFSSVNKLWTAGCFTRKPGSTQPKQNSKKERGNKRGKKSWWNQRERGKSIISILVEQRRNVVPHDDGKLEEEEEEAERERIELPGETQVPGACCEDVEADGRGKREKPYGRDNRIVSWASAGITLQQFVIFSFSRPKRKMRPGQRSPPSRRERLTMADQWRL